ncbi:hypothetical protein LCGC14_0372890 [marine sediment metagenome]|uniref:Uncharacterized protein n=1 Tax=marine sediment metagenome TaxID=412755 RepID=A0A0F9WDH4_9ZZZZ
MTVVRTRSTSFLDLSPALDGITEVLTILLKKPMYFNQMFRESKVQLKNASLRYFNICKDKGFIIGKEESLLINNGRGINKRPVLLMVYHVTAKGALFLELVK